MATIIQDSSLYVEFVRQLRLTIANQRSVVAWLRVFMPSDCGAQTTVRWKVIAGAWKWCGFGRPRRITLCQSTSVTH